MDRMSGLKGTRKAPDAIDRLVGSRVRMGRLMLGLSQSALADAIGVAFQQVQKYEKGTNRIGAGRLQQIAHFLQVPIPFFFEGAPGLEKLPEITVTTPSSDVSEFLSTSDGLALTMAFMQIKDAKLRRCLVGLVQQVAGHYED
jgi:transcriptional regulator with XRE-family HTH domain